MSRVVLGVAPSGLPLLSVSFAPFLLPHAPSLCDSSSRGPLHMFIFLINKLSSNMYYVPGTGNSVVSKTDPVSALMGLVDQCRDIGDEQQPGSKLGMGTGGNPG